MRFVENHLGKLSVILRYSDRAYYYCCCVCILIKDQVASIICWGFRGVQMLWLLVSGVLVRLTTCKRLTDTRSLLPKLPYYTLPPWNGGISGRSDIRADLSIIQAVSFPGYTGEITFQVRHGESLNKFIMADVGFEPTTQKRHLSRY